MAEAVGTGARAAPASDQVLISRLLRARETGVFLALLVMCIALSVATDGFLTSTNLFNVGRQVSLLGIMAVGMTFVLISGEVDLSVGSTYALSGLATGMLIIAGWALLPAIGVGLLTGMAVGLANGLLSTYGRLPSLIATLGMLSMVRGTALILTNGQPVTVNLRNGARPEVLDAFTFLGQGYLFGVFAVGGSAKAARVSGIAVNSVKIWAFVLMGLLAAFAGILSLAFLPSG